MRPVEFAPEITQILNLRYERPYEYVKPVKLSVSEPSLV